MKIIKVEKPSIPIGRKGENLATQVRFPVTFWRELYGNGSFQLVHQRSGDTAPYPCVITEDGNDIVWNVSSSDVASEGYGSAEISYTVGSTIAKSMVFETITEPSLGDTTEPPAAYKAWVDAVHADAETAAEAARTVPQTIATELQKAKASGEFKGDKGDKGDTGAKGDKGDKGDLYYPTFGINPETGVLSVSGNDASDLQFTLNSDTGNLEVTIT